MMEIEIGTEKDKDLWDEMVASSPGGTLFHTWDWLKLMEKYAEKKILFRRYTPKLIPIMVQMKGSTIGLLPVFLYKTPVLIIVASPPFAVENYYLGPILCDTKTTNFSNQLRFDEFFQTVDDYLKKTLFAQYISLHSAPGIADSRPLSWRGYNVQPSYTYEIDLSIGKKSLFSNFGSSLQRYIKKADTSDITIEEGNLADLRHLYAIMKDAGRIFAKEEFLLEIMERYSPTSVRLFTAKKDDTILSGLVNICFKNKVTWWVGCPACSYHGIYPNEVALWRSIEWAVDNGYDFYELMGADDRNLFYFKSKFNGALIPLFIAKWYSPIMRVGKSLFR